MTQTDTSNSQHGFSLVETCIALVFMMVVFVGVAPLLVYAVNYNSGAAIRAGALAVAQQKLEQLRATSFDNCTSSTETVSVGQPGNGLQTYTLQTTVVSTSSSLKTITIVVTPQGRTTSGGQYGVSLGWKYGQVTVYTVRTSIAIGSNLG
jgi:Tfp pilus assembly protein PilV